MSKRVVAVLVGLTLGAAPIFIPATATANPCRLPDGVLHPADLATRSAAACGAIGRLVDTGDGVPLPVQPPGRGVTLGLQYPNGSRTYTLTTDAQGRVTVTAHPAATAGHQPTQRGIGTAAGAADQFPDLPGPGACERDSYTLSGFKWYRPWLFRTTIGSSLGSGGQLAFDAASRRAVHNATQSRNTCGLRDEVSAVGAFVGHTTRRGNFLFTDTGYTCGGSDSHSVLDVGDQPGTFGTATLAIYCIWTVARPGLAEAESVDLRFNNVDYSWTYDPNDPACDPSLPPDQHRWRYDVESVMTHEAGHAFGLINLASADDINQTMFPAIRRCSGHMRTLGRGDVLGLRALY